MNELSMFRLKVQYKSENQATGEIEKVKTEFLAQCVNYTDAENLMNKIIELDNMDKFEPCVYDIAKAKFEASDIYGTNIMKADDKLVCGLIEHFFENDSEGLYAVETIVFGDKEAKEKDLKQTYYIPAANVADAMAAARKILIYHGHNIDDCLIPSTKLDKATLVFLRPTTSESIYKQATDIRLNDGL
jgi:hypothetical protein